MSVPEHQKQAHRTHRDFAFLVSVRVNRRDLRSALETHDKRSNRDVVADEIRSSLESVPYVGTVRVRSVNKEGRIRK